MKLTTTINEWNRAWAELAHLGGITPAAFNAVQERLGRIMAEEKPAEKPVEQ